MLAKLHLAIYTPENTAPMAFDIYEEEFSDFGDVLANLAFVESAFSDDCFTAEVIGYEDEENGYMPIEELAFTVELAKELAC